MAIERTFSMIKPDATRRNLTGAITQKLDCLLYTSDAADE